MSENNIDRQFIDVRQLMQELSVEELCQTAEDYYARLTSWDYHMALPFTGIDETPEMLIHFAQLLQGLRPLLGMTVLDFGAGSCWTSRCLTQLGYRVIALDVSKIALDIGRELYRRQPVFGGQPEPVFLPFDGHRIDLPDESVDRISCLNSFHHVPNPEHVIKELARVLKPGGIAGFSEPGPEHSKSPQSQYEMRMHKLVENDVKIEEIWRAAQEAGFTDLKLAIFYSMPLLLSPEEFEKYIAPREPGPEEATSPVVPAATGTAPPEHVPALKRLLRSIRPARLDASNGSEAPAALPPPPTAEPPDTYSELTRAYMRDRRVFFLYKGEMPAPDSRQRVGLAAELEVNLASHQVEEGTPFLARITVRNSGSNIWLPLSAPKAPVQLGVHLLDRNGTLINMDYSRHRLTPGEGRPIQPGETVLLETPVPSPPKGEYILSFDMVSEGITWFEMNGSAAVRLCVEVI